jgi:1-acyl-sn-glycerol-3-phosphate acyltransferase
MALWFNWRMEGHEHIPREGPILAACNHIGYLDPLAQGYFLVKAHRRPRFLAKSELFRKAPLKWVLNGAHQIKVERGTGDAGPVNAAVGALREGECVVIYPEGTITTNPDSSPMQAKTGLSRITLESGVPVTPIAVWGTHKVIPKGGKKDLSFARPLMVKAGAPMDFSGYGDVSDKAVLRRIADEVMAELSHLVEDLRTRYPKRWQ